MKKRLVFMALALLLVAAGTHAAAQDAVAVNSAVKADTTQGHDKAAPADVKVSGIVTDNSGEPIVGATVIVRGTSIGVTTDVTGAYDIRLPDPQQLLNGELQVSFYGLKTSVVPIAGRANVDVTLKKNSLFSILFD
jgi:hypothetical protein